MLPEKIEIIDFMCLFIISFSQFLKNSPIFQYYNLLNLRIFRSSPISRLRETYPEHIHKSHVVVDLATVIRQSRHILILGTITKLQLERQLTLEHTTESRPLKSRKWKLKRTCQSQPDYPKHYQAEVKDWQTRWSVIIGPR